MKKKWAIRALVCYACAFGFTLSMALTERLWPFAAALLFIGVGVYYANKAGTFWNE